MSIWCDRAIIGHDLQFAEDQPRGEVRSYAQGWSNHYPTTDGDMEQPASIWLSHVAPWCVPGNEAVEDEPPVGDWLQLGVHSWGHDFHDGAKPTGEPEFARVVLDEQAVRVLRDELTRWLEIEKVHANEAQR